MKNLLEGVKKKFFKKKKATEIPESKKLCPEAGDIKKAVCDLAIYLLWYVHGERLEKIREEFNLSNYSSVSNAISRVKRRLYNHKFKKLY